MLRAFDEGTGRLAFQRVAVVHHDDPVGMLANHPEVMGDQQQAHAQLAAQARQQFEDLCLHADIQRRGRLVGDQQPRLAGNRHGDHHPLALAAGQVLRVLVQVRSGARQLYQGKQFFGALPGLPAGEVGVGEQVFGDLLAQGQHRVEARQRVLENHPQRIALQLAHLPWRHAQQVTALEQHLPGQPGVVRQQAHQRQGRGGFTAAGFTHQRQCLAGLQGETQVFDGIGVVVAHAQTAYVQQAHGIYRRRRGLRASLRPSPRRLRASTTKMIASPGRAVRYQPLAICSRPLPSMAPQLA